MSEPTEQRVPMRPKFATWLSPDDVAASIVPDPPRCGKRFSLDVAEEALAQMSGAMVEHVAKRLAEAVVLRHELEIRDAILSYLRDRAWAEPIVKQAIRDAVRLWIRDAFADLQVGDLRG